MDMQQAAVEAKYAGYDNLAQNTHLHNQREYPSKRSVQCWILREQQNGDYKPYQQNGNNRATVLRGRMRYMLGYYRILFPKCTQAELNTVLYNCTPAGQVRRFYDDGQITRAEDDLGLA